MGKHLKSKQKQKKIDKYVARRRERQGGRERMISSCLPFLPFPYPLPYLFPTCPTIFIHHPFHPSFSPTLFPNLFNHPLHAPTLGSGCVGPLHQSFVSSCFLLKFAALRRYLEQLLLEVCTPGTIFFTDACLENMLLQLCTSK